MVVAVRLAIRTDGAASWSSCSEYPSSGRLKPRSANADAVLPACLVVDRLVDIAHLTSQVVRSAQISILKTALNKRS